MLKIALQMHSVREFMHLDPLLALEKCAEAGYRHIDLPLPLKNDPDFLYYGKTAQQWRSAAEELAISIDGGYAKPTPENAAAIIDFFLRAGASRIVIPIDYFPTEEILKRKCDFYNEFGRMCKSNGLSLWYENHYHEFQIINGNVIFDYLLANTDSELFSIALNTYWLMRGLVMPSEIISKYASRIRAIVQQDYPLKEIDKFNMWRFDRYHPIAKNIQYESILQGNEIENIHPVQCELFTEIGDGILPIQPVIDLAISCCKAECLILKQDYTYMPSEFDSVARSLRNMKDIRGLTIE